MVRQRGHLYLGDLLAVFIATARLERFSLTPLLIIED